MMGAPAWSRGFGHAKRDRPLLERRRPLNLKEISIADLPIDPVTVEKQLRCVGAAVASCKDLGALQQPWRLSNSKLPYKCAVDDIV